jgi:hypothetical protein
MAVQDYQPGYQTLTFGDRRAVLFVPDQLQRLNNKVVVAFTADSTCLYFGNKGTSDIKMGQVNGVDKAAAKFGFVVVHLLPTFRFFGGVYAWDADGQFMGRWRRKVDDPGYVHRVADHIRLKFGDRLVGDPYLVGLGFGDGAQFLQLCPGVFSDFVSIQGTRLGTEPSLPAGTGFWWVHGVDNVVLPLGGGYGGPFWLYFKLVASRHARNSYPWNQMAEACRANGVPFDSSGDGESDDKWPGVRLYNFTPRGHPVAVCARLVPGGHAYPSRLPIDSAVSKRQGGVPSSYPANDIWPVELLGMKALRNET